MRQLDHQEQPKKVVGKTRRHLRKRTGHRTASPSKVIRIIIHYPGNVLQVANREQAGQIEKMVILYLHNQEQLHKEECTINKTTYARQIGYSEHNSSWKWLLTLNILTSVMKCYD